MTCQKQFRFHQLGAVGGVLQIQIEAGTPGGYGVGKGGLSDLPRPD